MLCLGVVAGDSGGDDEMLKPCNAHATNMGAQHVVLDRGSVYCRTVCQRSGACW